MAKGNKKAKGWKTVPDENIRHVWKCIEEGCEEFDQEIIIAPTFYSDSGTPICGGDGHDKVYVRTEIRN